MAANGKNPVNLLVVEDDPLMGETLEQVLSQEGFLVRVVVNAEEALSVENLGDYGFVVSDVRLPGMQGPELIEKLRERNPLMRAIVITGFAGDDVPIECIRLGVEGYFLKPFDLDDFVGAVKTCVDAAAVGEENTRLLHQLKKQNLELLATRTRLERRLGELEMVRDIELMSNQPVPLPQLLQAIAETARQALGAGASSVILHDPENRRLVFQEATGEAGEKIKQVFLKEDQGIAGWVIGHGEAVVSNDPAGDPRFAREVSSQVGYAVRNLICVPMQAQGHTVGALEVLNSGDAAGFDEDDRLVLEALAAQAVQGLQTLRHREAQALDQRLSIVGKMVGVVLHDIRNPLSVVKGYTKLLRNKELPRDSQVDYLGKSLDNIDRITQLCEDLLGYMKGRIHLTLAPVAVSDVLDQVREQMARHLPSGGVELVLEGGGVDTVTADPGKLLRALVNLCRNATEAVGTQGTVRLHVRENADHMVFEVSDTGPGIETAQLQEVLKPFVSTKTSGAGLGLFIVQTIAKEHGGALSLANGPEGGLVATMTIGKHLHA